MCMFVENLIVIPLTLALADSSGSGEAKWHRILLATILSFVTISVVLWVLGPVLEWTMPH